MSYSSKVQEKLFRPYRIQILIDTSDGIYGKGREYGYRIVCRDATKQGSDSIVDSWLPAVNKNTVPCWKSDEIDGGRYFVSFSSKTAAVSKAKELAIELNLPFNLKTDIIKIEDLLHGPIRECVACGKAIKRGFTPEICAGCKDDLARGQSVRQMDSLQPVAIEPSRISRGGRYRSRREGEPDMEEIVFLLTGQLCEDTRGGKVADVAALVNLPRKMKEVATKGYFGSEWKTVLLSGNQVKGIVMLNQLLINIRQSSLEEGMRRGKNFLFKMANGELSANDLVDRQAREDK